MSNTLQYTVRGITPVADATLRAQAKKQGISLNKLVLQKLGSLPKTTTKPKVYHDLDWFLADKTPEQQAAAEELDRIIWEERRAAKERARLEFEAEQA